MENNVKVPVMARNNGRVGYLLKDSGIQRTFVKNEVKQIELGELKQLQWEKGGDYLLRNSLLIDSEEALKELNLIVEPEYFYTEETVKELLDNGSLDQLEDCLNFGPDGVKELIKSYAVKSELPDMRKRDLITKITGFNVTGAINLNKSFEEPVDETEEKPAESAGRVRKSTPITKAEPEKPQRRAAAPSKYKIVSEEK